MKEINETISALEQKLQELILDYKKRGPEYSSNFSANEISFYSLAEELDEGILLLNNNGQAKYCNPSGLKLFHSLNGSKDYKKHLSHFAESKQLFDFEKNIQLFIGTASIEKSKFNLDFISIDGNKMSVSVKLKILEYFSGSELLLIFSFDNNKSSSQTFNREDIFLDELGLLEEKAENLLNYTNKLKKTKEELKEINSKKDKFFNIIAHDLRAPFNSILGLTEMLRVEAGELSVEEISDLAGRIYNSSKNVLEMVEDLLNWARMQTNHIDFNPQNIKIADMVFDILYLLKHVAVLKNIKIETDIDEEIKIFADRNMLNLVLRNLVSNAIKFTPNGGEISVFAYKNGNKVKIGVKDNGVGIKTENLQKILTIDEHYSELGTNNEKGTGLGLVLCQEFLTQNGTKLNIESEFGLGSIFSFSLPAIT